MIRWQREAKIKLQSLVSDLLTTGCINDKRGGRMTGQMWWKCYIHDSLLENGASHTTQALGISTSLPCLLDERHGKLVSVIGELRHIWVLRGETEFLKQI